MGPVFSSRTFAKHPVDGGLDHPSLRNLLLLNQELWGKIQERLSLLRKKSLAEQSLEGIICKPKALRGQA